MDGGPEDTEGRAHYLCWLLRSIERDNGDSLILHGMSLQNDANERAPRGPEVQQENALRRDFVDNLANMILSRDNRH